VIAPARAVAAPLTHVAGPQRIRSLLQLQRVAGNRAVASFLQRAVATAPPVGAKPKLPEAAPKQIPGPPTAALNLFQWLVMTVATAHLEEILTTLLLLKDKRVELDVEFQKQSGGEPLRDVLKKKLSGKDRIRALRYFDEGQLHLADKIYFAAIGAGTDKPTLFRLLAEAAPQRNAVEKKFIDEYSEDYPKDGTLIDKERSKSRIAGLLEDELKFTSEGNFTALPKAKAIYTYGELRAIDEVHLAITIVGTNTDDLFDALGRCKDAKEATKLYKESYGEDLEKTLTDTFSGELSFNDKLRAQAFFKGELNLVKTVELLIGFTTDEEGIFRAITKADPEERQKLRDELDKPASAVAQKYNAWWSGLDADDKARINALLPPSKAATPAPAAHPDFTGTVDTTNEIIKLLQSEGGTHEGAAGTGNVFRAIKMSQPPSWRKYREAYWQRRAFTAYVDRNVNNSEMIQLQTILSEKPTSLMDRIYLSMGGLGDDELYLFHLLAYFPKEDSGEGPTRRALAVDEHLRKRMEDKLNSTELTRARALMRPKDLTPEERVAWINEDVRRSQSRITNLTSNTADALADEHRELLAAYARAKTGGKPITAEEEEEIKRLEQRTKGALDAYIEVRDEFEGYAVTAITMAVGLLATVATGGAAGPEVAAALATQIARAALFSAITRLATEKIVKGDRFELASNEAFAAFAGGAVDGIMSVVGGGAAKKLVGPLLGSLESMGPTAARFAAGKSFKVMSTGLTKVVEGGMAGGLTTAVETAAHDETWQLGMTKALGTIGSATAGGAGTGAVMAPAMHGVEHVIKGGGHKGAGPHKEGGSREGGGEHEGGGGRERGGGHEGGGSGHEGGGHAGEGSAGGPLLLERGYYRVTARPEYVVQVGTGDASSYHIFPTKEAAHKYARWLAGRGEPFLRETGARPRVLEGGAQNAPIAEVYVREVPAKTPVIQGVRGPQTEHGTVVGKEPGVEVYKGGGPIVIFPEGVKLGEPIPHAVAHGAGSIPVRAGLTVEQFRKNPRAQEGLFRRAKEASARQQALADRLMAENDVQGGEARSILKRNDPKDFAEKVLAKCDRNKYTNVLEMDDIIRGRFNLASAADVEKIALALQKQTQYRVIQVIRPRAVAGVEGGYPRWHIIVRDGETGLTHEWQVGTRAVSEVFETPKMPIPDALKPLPEGMHADIHDIEYDVFKRIQEHDDPRVRALGDRLGIPDYRRRVAELAAKAGSQGDVLLEGKAGPQGETVTPLHKELDPLLEEGGKILQGLVDARDPGGPEFVKRFYH
jgi:hypothetical protein